MPPAYTFVTLRTVARKELKISSSMTKMKAQNPFTEYHGCFWHKHFCHKQFCHKHFCHSGYGAVWNKTMEREEKLKRLGYNVVSITSCQWIRTLQSKDWYPPPRDNRTEVAAKTQEEILDEVRNDVLEGFAGYDAHVPEKKNE